MDQAHMPIDAMLCIDTDTSNEELGRMITELLNQNGDKGITVIVSRTDANELKSALASIDRSSLLRKNISIPPEEPRG